MTKRKEKVHTTADLDDGHLILLRAMVAHDATIHYSRDGELAWLSGADGSRFPVLPPELTLQPLRDTRMLSYDADDELGNDSNTTRITQAGRDYAAAREGQGVGRQFLAVAIACRPKPPAPPRRDDGITSAARAYGPSRRDAVAAKSAILSAIAAKRDDEPGDAADELARLVSGGEPYGHGAQAAIDKAEWILRVIALSAAIGTGTPVATRAGADDLDGRRGEKADAAFEAYDFGTYAIGDTSGWERTEGGNRFDRTIWFESQDGEPDAKGSFTVTFGPGTDTVLDAYGTCNGEDVGSRASA